MKSFSFVIEILVTVILVFLVPVFFFSYQQELLLQGYAQYEVIYFTDSIRNTGYISARRYEEFKEKLAVTNHVYEMSYLYMKRIVILVKWRVFVLEPIPIRY